MSITETPIPGFQGSVHRGIPAYINEYTDEPKEGASHHARRMGKIVQLRRRAALDRGMDQTTIREILGISDAEAQQVDNDVLTLSTATVAQVKAGESVMVEAGDTPETFEGVLRGLKEPINEAKYLDEEVRTNLLKLTELPELPRRGQKRNLEQTTEAVLRQMSKIRKVAGNTEKSVVNAKTARLQIYKSSTLTKLAIRKLSMKRGMDLARGVQEVGADKKRQRTPQ